MTQRLRTDMAVKNAEVMLNEAPSHIKAMAGNYIKPIMDAIKAINAELEQLEIDLINGEK